MSTTIKVEETEFGTTEILDNAIDQIGQEVKDLIELLNDDKDDDSNSVAIRYPGLTLKSTKRDHDNTGISFINY